MKWVEDSSNGYIYAYCPAHPCANKAGKVMQHVYVMYKAVHRLLGKNECVHHVDRDRKNNRLSNLRLMSNVEHAILHAKEDRNAVRVKLKCPICHTRFISTEVSNKKFCSGDCYFKHRVLTRRFELTREKLHYLVWKYPTTRVAKMFGVSDKAISRRCTILGVEKPPRGYWTKQYRNTVPDWMNW